jgi:fructose/tagatose bisphosphate aldolase
MEHIPSMNNEVEFAIPAHNLLKKTDVENTTRQAHKNRMASILASPQAARKKRFTKLDLTLLMTSQMGSIVPIHTDHKAESEDQKPSPSDHIRLPGSISKPAARNKLTYD